MTATHAFRWTCSCCGETHEGLSLDFAFQAPDEVFALAHDARSEVALTHDFCSVGDTFYVRGLMEMPVEGLGDPLGWGVWVEVDAAGMSRAIDMFDKDASPDEPPVLGRLANALPPFPGSKGQQVAIRFRSSRHRPAVLAEEDGAMRDGQRLGVPFETVEALNRPFHEHGSRRFDA